MATIKDKIGLAMLPSAQSGGASTSETDFSGTVHSLLPIQHETPDLVDIIPNTTDVNTGGVYTDVTWISDHDFGIGDLLKVTFTLKGLSSTTRAWGYNEFYPKDNVTEYTDGTYTAYWDVISSASITRAFRFYQASSPRTGTISIDRVVKVVNGDFKFERSSSATRVGSDGYIKNVEVLSDELVQNGRFDYIGSELSHNPTCDDSIPYGDIGSGYREQDGLDQVYFYNGGIKTERLRTGNLRLRLGTSLGSSVVIESNKIYKVSFDVIDADFSGDSSSQILFYFDGNIQNASISETPGSYEFYVKSGSVGNGVAQWAFNNQNIGSYAVFDNISVKEVGQDWTFVGDATMDGSKGVFPTPSQYSQLTSSTVIVANKKYRFSADINFINAVDNSFGWRYTGGPIININSSDVVNGKYSQEFTAPSDGSFWFQTVGGTYPGVNVEIDNISVVEVTDDTDIPRLDFSNAAQPSLLLEPQRSNLLTQSEYFGADYTLSNTDIINNNTTSPEGLQNATKIYPLSSGNFRHIRYIALSPASGLYTFSIFAKAAELDHLVLIDYDGSGVGVDYNLTTGVATDNASTGFDDIDMIPYGDGWYRCIATATNPYFYWILSDNGGVSVTANGTNGLYIWGAQAEQGSYPTSYIPTNGETNGVTRNADVCNNAGDSTIFNDAEGVLYVEIKFNETTTNSDTYGISLNDGSSSNRVTIYNNSSSSSDIITPRVYKGGSSVTAADVTSTGNPPLKPSNQYNKIAVKYDSNGIYVYANGHFLRQRTGFDCSFPEGTLKSISFDNAGDGMEGDIRQLLYFNQSLTDEELETLTSSDITQVLRNYNRRGELLGATYESAHVQTKLNELF